MKAIDAYPGLYIKKKFFKGYFVFINKIGGQFFGLENKTLL
jgi:hypothetical protein